MREIEIKLKIKNFENLEKKLQEKMVSLSEPISQRDVVYSLAGSNNEFTSAKEGDIIFRIRYLKESAELNLKKQKSNEMDNIEYETKLGDPEAMHQILLILGYRPSVEVRKIRRKGKLGSYEICLDQVETLGDFVELEKLTNDEDNPEIVREELFKELEALGVLRDDEEVRGYDTQIYELTRNK